MAVVHPDSSFAFVLANQPLKAEHLPAEVPLEWGRIIVEKPHQPEVRGSSSFLQFLYAACVSQSVGVATVTPSCSMVHKRVNVT